MKRQTSKKLQRERLRTLKREAKAARKKQPKRVIP
jgi:hypothetical protein